MRALFILLLTPVLFFSCKTKTAEGMNEAGMTTTADKSAEFADARYTEIGQRHMTMFETGNIDGWSAMFADDAKWYWSGGDSIIGKQAIVNYWKDRRANVIESVDISNDIWLPVKVNKSQQQADIPGVWLLSWQQFNTKYKNGKTLSGWVHNGYHFNKDDKVDQWIQYMDRSPIQAATGAK